MFSVIMPVYNGEKFIETAIKSVMAQTFSDWELIVIDDGSADGTPNILNKYTDHDKIRIITQPNQGVSAARNNGILAANGEHIAFLDSDDIWYEDHLAVMHGLIKKYPGAGLYGTFTKTELQNGREITECDFFKNREDDVFLDDFFAEYYKDTSAKMFTVITTCITREAFDKTGGFPIGCKIGEDLELSLKIAAYFPVVLSKKCTAAYKKGNSVATKDISFDPDWGFFHTVEDIYLDESIPSSKRENLKKLMQWFSMRRFRHYMIDGKRRQALKVYRDTDKSCLGLKDRIINSVLMLLPSPVIYKIFALRWKGQA